jgi:hypothetical protein
MKAVIAKTRAAMIAGLVVCLSVILYAYATPKDVFELEGDVADVPNDSLDDWETLNGNGIGNPPGSAGGSSVRAFVQTPKTRRSSRPADRRTTSTSAVGGTPPVRSPTRTRSRTHMQPPTTLAVS